MNLLGDRALDLDPDQRERAHLAVRRAMQTGKAQAEAVEAALVAAAAGDLDEDGAARPAVYPP